VPPVLDLRLIVITDRVLAAPRIVLEIVAAALEAGAPAIQLRDKQAPAGDIARLALALLPLVRAARARLFINDRVDVALAVGADGVHLGPDDLPVDAARRIAPPGFLIGYSTDDPATAQAAAAAGASYIGCGAIFGTATKAAAASERIGTGRLDAVARAVDIPVIGIGGIDPSNIDAVAGTAAAGAAVVGAVMAAPDPGAAVRRLLEPFDRRRN
jgi:thiamine-phosphate pyrophosphorylase